MPHNSHVANSVFPSNDDPTAGEPNVPENHGIPSYSGDPSALDNSNEPGNPDCVLALDGQNNPDDHGDSGDPGNSDDLGNPDGTDFDASNGPNPAITPNDVNLSTPNDLSATLAERDAQVIAGIEKLRFYPFEVISGKGSTLFDPSGYGILDLNATWTATGLGHGHPAVVEAVTHAISTAPGMGALSQIHPDSVGLAEDLLALVRAPMDVTERRVYLGHSGSDANDVAIRACRHATGKRIVLAYEHSYHGGLGLAMGVSGLHVENGAAAADPDTIFLPYPNPYHPRGSSEADVAYCLAETERALAGPEVACLIIEPILSDGGFIVPPTGFFAAVARTAHAHGVLVIVDEVKVGLARTGTLHAYQHDGLTPDIVTFGRSLGAGLPISAVVGPAWVLDGPHGTALLTTAGNPVCTAAARAVLKTLVREGFPERARVAGERFMGGLKKLSKQDDSKGAILAQHIGDIRGRGLAIGLEIVTDPESRTRDAVLAEKIVYRLWQLGAAVFTVGGNVLEITPPLVITDEEIDQAVEMIGEAIYDAATGMVPDDLVADYTPGLA